MHDLNPSKEVAIRVPTTLVPNCMSYFCTVVSSIGGIITPLSIGIISSVACNQTSQWETTTYALLIRMCNWLSFLIKKLAKNPNHTTKKCAYERNSVADLRTEDMSERSSCKKMASFPVCCFSSAIAAFALAALRAAR